MTSDEWDEVVITYAALLGCEPSYNDYGHPERARARMYWTADCPEGVYGRAYGYTRAHCALTWLRLCGYKVLSSGTIIRKGAHS